MKTSDKFPGANHTTVRNIVGNLDCRYGSPRRFGFGRVQSKPVGRLAVERGEFLQQSRRVLVPPVSCMIVATALR